LKEANDKEKKVVWVEAEDAKYYSDDVKHEDDMPIMMDSIPSGKFGDEEGGQDCADETADGDDSLEDALGEGDVEVDGVYVGDDLEIYCGEVDVGIGEVYL
jgi:hypothetical protein